jgi:hypothetical protein
LEDSLFCYVYYDLTNAPSEIMLQWSAADGTGWNHRAYWGSDNIAGERTLIGSLPGAGSWVRLEVPASAVNLEGRTVNGMAFSLYNGQATWDYAGKCRLQNRTNPLDVDADGLADPWELFYFGNLSQGGLGDWNANGRSNLEEFHQATNPTAGVGLQTWTPLK